jgi:hypothetical protein
MGVPSQVLKHHFEKERKDVLGFKNSLIVEVYGGQLVYPNYNLVIM